MKEAKWIILKESKAKNVEVLSGLLLDLIDSDKKNEKRVIKLYNKR